MNILPAIALLSLATSSLSAANFLFRFDPTHVTTEQDTHFSDLYRQPDGSSLDTTSRVYTSTSDYDTEQPDNPTSSLNAAMRGRSYDGDPFHGTEWGILSPESVSFTESPDIFTGYVVKYGLKPTAVGSTKASISDGTGADQLVDASYLNFQITSSDEVLFSELSLTITNLRAIEATDVAWAGTNADGFTSAVQPVIMRDDALETSTLTFTWSNVNLVATDLDIRIYGIKGSDYGNFTAGILRGTVEPPPVPEAHSALLLLGSLWGFCSRRQRTALA